MDPTVEAKRQIDRLFTFLNKHPKLPEDWTARLDVEDLARLDNGTIDADLICIITGLTFLEACGELGIERPEKMGLIPSKELPSSYLNAACFSAILDGQEVCMRRYRIERARARAKGNRSSSRRRLSLPRRRIA